MKEHTAGILIRRVAWSETSWIVTWVTDRFGTLKTSARGARRPGSAFAGRLDLFYHAEVVFTPSRQGDLHALGEVSVLAPFEASRAGTAGLYLAAYFAELASIAAQPMLPSEEIFDLLRRALDYLQREAATPKALSHFEREMCRVLGIHDASGTVGSAMALDSLYGRAPESRAAALRMMTG